MTFSGNSAEASGGAIYNASGASISSIAAAFSDNTAAGSGGAIFNAGEMTIGGTSTFSGNTDSTGKNDIYNTGTLNFGSDDIANIKTTIGSGISGSGVMTLHSGAMEIAENIHVDQGSATFKSGTTTMVTLNESHLVKDGSATNVSEVDAALLAKAKQQKNGDGGYVIHTTGNLTIENGAKLVVKGIDLFKTYLVAYAGEKPGASSEAQPQQKVAAKRMMAAAVPEAGVTSEGWTEVDGTLTADTTNPLIKAQRVAGDAGENTVMVTTVVNKDGNLPFKPAIYIPPESEPEGEEPEPKPVSELDGDKDAVKHFNSVTDLASMSGVKNMTWAGGGMFGRALENHLSLSRTLQLQKEGVDLHEKEHQDLWVDVIGSHNWNTGTKTKVAGRDNSANNKHGLRADLGGIVVGLDRTSEDGNKHFGIAGMAGTGHAGTTGGRMNHTENDMDFWGLAVYGGWDKDNWNVAGHIAYSSFDSDVTQKSSSVWGAKPRPILIPICGVPKSGANTVSTLKRIWRSSRISACGTIV